MAEQTPQTPPATPEPARPAWLDTANPQADLIKVFNDVFKGGYDPQDICNRLKKALSEVQAPPTAGIPR